MSLAIRPIAALNAATASGGSTLSSLSLSSNRREATILPFLSTILADKPISAAGFESTAIRNHQVITSLPFFSGAVRAAANADPNSPTGATMLA
jgi:hypothetical protein